LLEMVEVVANRGQLITFLASVIGLWLLLQTATPEQRDMLAVDWAVGIQAFALALVGWSIISALRAPLVVIRNERAKGDWLDRRRIYFEPQLVGVSPFTADNKDCAEVVFDDAEPGSLVTYRIDIDPPYAHASCYMERRPGELWAFMHRGRAGGRGKVRLIGRRAFLRVRLPEHAMPVTARVYMSEFEVPVRRPKDELAEPV